MSTLPVVEEILRETGTPMSVREIVERAGSRLPTKSKTPDTVVARDLSMDIKRKGESSPFIRTSPGRYTMRAFIVEARPGEHNGEGMGDGVQQHEAFQTSPPATVGDGNGAMMNVRKDRAAPIPAHGASQPSESAESVPASNR